MKIIILILILILNFQNCKNSFAIEDRNAIISGFGMLLYSSNRVSISGSAAKGVIRYANVSVYPVSADGTCNKSRALASENTDGSGNYSVRFTKTGGLVCIITSASPDDTSVVYDEKTKSDLVLSPSSKFELVSILPESKIISNSRKNQNTSPFSRFAAKRFQSLVKEAGSSSPSLLVKANKEVVIRFGLSTGLSGKTGKEVKSIKNVSKINGDTFPELDDILVEIGKPTDPINAKYISILGGFSWLANKYKKGSQVTTDDIDSIVEAFALDFEDGIFDGKQKDGKSITIGTAPNSLVFPSDPLSLVLLPAIESYIKEGGNIDAGTTNLTNTNITVTASNITSQVQFYGLIPIEFNNIPLTISGTITGLTKAGLTLSSGTNPIQTVSPPINATSFQFANQVSSGTSYNITITSQPAGITCSITNGTGIISSNPNISILCEPINSLYLTDTLNGILYNYKTGNNGVLSSNGNIATTLTNPYQTLWNGKHIVVNGGNVFRSYLRNLDGTLSFANTYTATNVPVLPQGTTAFHSSGKFFYYTVNTGASVQTFSKLQMDTNGLFSGEVNTGTGQNWSVMGPIHPTGNYFMTFHSSSTNIRQFYSITDLNTGTISGPAIDNSIPVATLNPSNGHCIYSLNGNHLYCANISNSGNNGKIVQMSVTSISNTLLSPPDLLVESATVWESPKSLVIHPSGNYIFAYGNTNIYSYSVNQATGIINPTAISSIPTPGGAGCTTNQGGNRLAIHPLGNMLYAACVKPTSSNNLGAYPISSNGVLSSPTLTLIPSTTSNIYLVFVPGN